MNNKLIDLNVLEKTISLDKPSLFNSKESKSDGIVYRGVRVIHNDKHGTCIVTVQRSSQDEEEILVHKKAEWGNRTKGAENLSRAILTDYFNDEVPEKLVKLFKIEFISLCDFNGWILTEEILRAWLEIKRQEYEE